MIQPLPKATQVKACKADENIEQDAQYVVAIGDALYAPFWPEGTGMSRGILSVLHAGFTLHSIWKPDSTADKQKILKKSDKWAKVVAEAQSRACQGNFILKILVFRQI